MPENKKLTKQQQANKKEYNKLRDNLKRRMKRLSDKGYYVKEDYSKKIELPTITELGRNPNKRDIEKLKKISSKYINEAYYKTFYSETGQQKELPLAKARNIERSEAAKKGVETKKFYKQFPEFKKYVNKKGSKTHIVLPTDENGEIILPSDENGELILPIDENGEIIYDDSDLPFGEDYSESNAETESEEFPYEYSLPMSNDTNIDTSDLTKTAIEEDIVLQNLDEILYNIEFSIRKLFGFKSSSKNTSKAKDNEEFVYNKAQIVLNKFMELTNITPYMLAQNCQLYSAQIVSLIEAIKYSYRDPRSFEQIFTDLVNYFTGKPSITEEAAINMESSFEYETGGEYIYD